MGLCSNEINFLSVMYVQLKRRFGISQSLCNFTKAVSFSISNRSPKIFSNCLTSRGKSPQLFVFKNVFKKKCSNIFAANLIFFQKTFRSIYFRWFGNCDGMKTIGYSNLFRNFFRTSHKKTNSFTSTITNISCTTKNFKVISNDLTNKYYQ